VTCGTSFFGGSDVDESVPEARLIAAAMVGLVLRLPPHKLITNEELRTLEFPLLALLGGRSVMLDPKRDADKAQTLLPQAQIEAC
jgi:hypothetical protein